ncbi:hypothetical protein FOA43_004070 [Brettanomyces nanus]|uniref:Protein kinase domain-containing protein n=1 Tax=Eeniella nana TaxID=13502 RepID=A0A875S5S6_EENNA|nr:uncharacterized protein FOA43_004070 [Brettanomyces nanus]QPG76676.1 hypothetical protein FOA43_004070 [Brettanomyces nanus]
MADHMNDQAHYQRHKQHEDYSEVARDLVRRESEAEEEIRQRSRRSIQRYKVMEKLGEGAFSKVYKAQNIQTGDYVAVKVIEKFQLDEKQRASVLKEVALMRQLEHPNIVKFIDFIENEQCFYIVQELVEGGELFNQVVKYTYLSEDLSRHVIIQVAEALIYLHETVGIVHRDLKPENIFFDAIQVIPSRNRQLRRSDDPNTKLDEGEFTMNYGGGGVGMVKIGDFGLSKQIIANNSLKTPCGTIGYTAPEIVKDLRYSKEVDMWALGCVLYILLCGFPPFFNDSIDELTRKVANGEYEFLSPWWDEISDGAKHCVSKLLTVNPHERYTISEFMNDPWILEFLQRSESFRGPPQTAFGAVQTPVLPISNTYFEMAPIANNYSWGEFNSAALPRYESMANSKMQQQPPLQVFRQDKDIFSPAVIAMREAMDITTVAHRLHEEGETEAMEKKKKKTNAKNRRNLGNNVLLPLAEDLEVNDYENRSLNSEIESLSEVKPFVLKMGESLILQRRRNKTVMA